MKTVLIVEHDRHLLDGIRAILEIEGYSVIGTEDSFEGIDLAIKNLPDVFVTERRLPGLGSYELLAKLQQAPETQRIPVIFLTEKLSHEESHHLTKIGVMTHVTKPFSADELLVAVHVCTNGKYFLRD